MPREEKYELKKYYYPHVGYPKILVKPKQPVKKGDVLCMLDRLGVSNEIVAHADGTIEDIDLGAIGTLAQCGEYILTLKYRVTGEELRRRAEERRYQFIKAPWEASYWLTENPNAPPILNVGDYVKKGQLVSVAMIAKQKREVKSDLEGIVGKIYFNKGEVKKEGDRLIGIRKGK